MSEQAIESEKIAVPVAETVVALDTSDKAFVPAKQAASEEATSSKKKDIRHHPKLPYSYKVTKYGEIYTVVERLGRVKERASLIKTIKQKYARYKKLLPLFWRFSKETMTPLGKRRIALYLLGNVLISLIPSWQYAATWELTELTRKAIETRKIDVVKMLKAAAVDVAGYVLEKTLESPLEENKSRLQYRFRALVKEHILSTRIRLDAVTSEDQKVLGKIRSAKQLLGVNWQQSFLLEHFSKILSDTSALVSESLLVHKMAQSGNGSLAAVSFLSNLLLNFRSFMQSAFIKFDTAITDGTYRRMDTMMKLSESSGAQDQLLCLRSYYLREYQKAAAAMGDVSTKEPDVYAEAWARPWTSMFFNIARKANEAMMYILFAISAISKPDVTLGDSAAAMSDLYLLRDSTSRLSKALFDLLGDATNFTKILQPIEQYYALEDIKPLLRLKAEPVRYQAASRIAPGSPLEIALKPVPNDGEHHSTKSDDGTLVEDSSPPTPRRAGMSIEFKNVSFSYPHQKKKALDNVSFRIEAGELCSIVGFSGSGKSTLISLLVRLHDPDTGSIFVNDVDITWYDPEDLYKKISMLFQNTGKVDVTLREFIRMGDIETATDADIEKAVEESGATEIIAKLKDGYDTELEGRGWWGSSVTVDQLVKRAQMHEWEDRYFGQNADLYGAEEEDTDVDEITDEDSRKLLIGARVIDILQSELDKRTKLAAKWRLPEAPGNELEILTEGYDASKANEPNNESGANFSGGEWAKVVLARSFLRKGINLQILDEFSAALDPMSEADIFKRFMSRLGRLTMIVVTHRFYLACRSDRILFMKGGKLLENGSHRELMKLEGEYHKMYIATSAPAGDRKEIACQTGEDEAIAAESTAAEGDAVDEVAIGGEKADLLEASVVVVEAA